VIYLEQHTTAMDLGKPAERLYYWNVLNVWPPKRSRRPAPKHPPPDLNWCTPPVG
jgi:hypothetical protein